MSFERFCQPVCFFAARFTLRQPKTPVGNATNLRTFCFEYLWHWLIRSLYFIQVYIFIPLIHSAPFLRFSHILLYTNFFWCICITTRNIFLIPDDAVARNLIIILNFSSQRLHLNDTMYFLTLIVLLQWSFPRNISANLLIFTNKASNHVVIV